MPGEKRIFSLKVLAITGDGQEIGKADRGVAFCAEDICYEGRPMEMVHPVLMYVRRRRACSCRLPLAKKPMENFTVESTSSVSLRRTA